MKTGTLPEYTAQFLTGPVGVMRRTEPSRPALDRNAGFKYVRSEATDIRKTFIKARKQ
jgi:hypothetical protein